MERQCKNLSRCGQGLSSTTDPIQQARGGVPSLLPPTAAPAQGAVQHACCQLKQATVSSNKPAVPEPPSSALNKSLLPCPPCLLSTCKAGRQAQLAGRHSWQIRLSAHNYSRIMLSLHSLLRWYVRTTMSVAFKSCWDFCSGSNRTHPKQAALGKYKSSGHHHQTLHLCNNLQNTAHRQADRETTVRSMWALARSVGCVRTWHSDTQRSCMLLAQHYAHLLEVLQPLFLRLDEGRQLLELTPHRRNLCIKTLQGRSAQSVGHSMLLWSYLSAHAQGF